MPLLSQMLSEISQAAYIVLLLIFVPLPYATDQKINKAPIITYGLILANVLIFALFVFPNLGTIHENDLFDKWGVVPRSPRLINLLAYMFLHISLAHLLWNSAFLWLFGPSGEDTLGHLPFLIFFLSGGIVAGLLHVAIVLLFAQNSAVAYAPMVGASGGIAAIIGLYALRFYRSKIRMVWLCAAFLKLRTANFNVPAVFGLGIWFAQNLISAIAALIQPDKNGIAYWAHIGGFIFGMTVAEVMGMMGQGMREYLFADAINAGERGGEGARAVVRNFQVMLQRKPDDNEVKEALADLAQQAQTKGSPEVYAIVGEAYSLLLEQSLSIGNTSSTREWKTAFDQMRADDIVKGQALIRLAEIAAQAGDVSFAERIYLKVKERHPSGRERVQAILGAASVMLDTRESPNDAISLLSQLIDDRSTKQARTTRGPLAAFWRRITSPSKTRRA
jgi:membrane associated rhomboid family serine protease